MDLAPRISSKGRNSHLRCKVMFDRSWYIFITAPWKDSWLRFLALRRISSFTGKSMRQHTVSLGGSVSLPLGHIALWICSKVISVSGDLSSRSLKIVVTIWESWLGSIDSGTPLTRRLHHLPWMSRSSLWLLISLR